ncbi:hypothetical protein PMT9312_1331 [Prochlorococcus marinus str. MIT 9312]|uniref:Phosphoheptose isomerase n=1 Tax=Prochlorococcus marinus (strain MIT 9312) TaxID=74546 RepID=Q319Q4_PROM9|nr:hypothetical protein [Prochlorococcus marinus]ABB50391.1 hypothetical protein PMT9312_1331 [Prochlorococcus marinus str. MIT 9312]KGF99985.1 N-Acetylneuraminate cytidylyltransferase [Prochlorococcus marinus str. MIT 9311]
MQNKVIAFDLDDVLCYRTSNEGDIEKYKSCKPIKSMINILNKCKSKGYKIIIYTSRGMTVFKGNRDLIYDNLFDITTRQLREWGVNYDQLIMGKVHYDLLIDDKALNNLQIKSLSDVDIFLNDIKAQ